MRTHRGDPRSTEIRRTPRGILRGCMGTGSTSTGAMRYHGGACTVDRSQSCTATMYWTLDRSQHPQTHLSVQPEGIIFAERHTSDKGKQSTKKMEDKLKHYYSHQETVHKKPCCLCALPLIIRCGRCIARRKTLYTCSTSHPLALSHRDVLVRSTSGPCSRCDV